MEFAILGPLEVRDGPAPVRVPGAKERALLADLLVNSGRVVPADRLVEDLWGDDPPGNPANTLQGRVSALRRALGPAGGALVTRPPGYLLEAGPEQVDAGRFERLVAEATAAAAGEGPRAARQLEEALGLWRGPALAEFADQPWAQAEAARLEELRLAATEALVELRLAAGGHAGLVGELEGLVAAHPTRERLRGQLMVALYRSGGPPGRRLGAYQQAREVLAEELGIDPSPELQRLHHQILLQDPALEAAVPDRALPRHNLPERLTSLVGREGELREVAKLVEEHRLVTVTGPGGAGKTSLAVALAERLAAGYPDGVWLVELAALREPALLGEAVAAVLGLDEAAGTGTPPPSRAERLASFVPDKAMLLVLDNCEHLVEACAGLARRLLEAGPRLRVLATSREVLGVPGEVVWPIPPLAVPAAADDTDAGTAEDARQATAPEALAGFDAVRLFVERAASADPGFVLDAASAPVVAELCRRLDGLPLAIELAAARTRALPPVELAARLEDRFRLPPAAPALDPRQQTPRATVDWSWGRSRKGPAPCGAVGVLAAGRCGRRGGVRRRAGRGRSLVGCSGLVDRSLVVAAGGARPVHHAGRWAYGPSGWRGRRVRDAGRPPHRLVLELAEQAAVHRTARHWLRRSPPTTTLRAALDRTVAGREVETALRLAAALAWFWWTTRTIEGRQRMAGVLAMADGQPPTPHLARTLQASAMLQVSLTPTAATVDAARRSQELLEGFGDWPGAAFSKLPLAYAELQRRGPGEASPAWPTRPYTTFREFGDHWGEAYAERGRFAFEAYYRGMPERAEESGQQAIARFQELDDPWGLAQAQFSLGEFAKARGDLARAEAAYEAALTAGRDAGPLWVVLASLAGLGGLVALRGDDARAAVLHAEVTDLIRRTGEYRGFGHLYNELGGVARVRGDLERARQLHQEALAILRDVIGWSVPHTLAQLACAEARLGDLDAATTHLQEAAGLLLARPQPGTAASVLGGAALVAIGRGQAEQAARRWPPSRRSASAPALPRSAPNSTRLAWPPTPSGPRSTRTPWPPPRPPGALATDDALRK
jgi:predicted ATPase/DNA-binding SARP family transcriptional activator